MPSALPPEIIQLRNTYAASQGKLIDIIAGQTARGNVTAYRKAILTQVNAEIKVLDQFAAQWSAEHLPINYNLGRDATYQALRQAGVPVSQVAMNTRTINIITQNATDRLLQGNQLVGRRIADEIRRAGNHAIAQKLTTGATVRETKKNLIQALTNKGILSVPTKNGRQINLAAYAQTVARSTTREATNLATIQAMTDTGHDLVKMSHHNSPCRLCSTLEGRVYSISGKDPNYPPLDRAHGEGYANIHPNCKHVLAPYFEKFDKNAARTREVSNRPFNVDQRNAASKRAYEAAQKNNQLLRADRAQWERYKARLPNDAPGSFSAFRRMKTANSPGYQNLQGLYRDAGRKLAPAKPLKAVNPFSY